MDHITNTIGYYYHLVYDRCDKLSKFSWKSFMSIKQPQPWLNVAMSNVYYLVFLGLAFKQLDGYIPLLFTAVLNFTFSFIQTQKLKKNETVGCFESWSDQSLSHLNLVWGYCTGRVLWNHYSCGICYCPVLLVSLFPKQKLFKFFQWGSIWLRLPFPYWDLPFELYRPWNLPFCH